MHAQFSLESQLSFIDFPPQFLSRYIETNVVAVNTNFPRWIDFGAEKNLHSSSTYILLTLWKNEQTLDSIKRGGYTNWVIAGVLVHQDMLGLWTFGRPIGGSGHPPQKHAAQGVCAHIVLYQRCRFAAVSLLSVVLRILQRKVVLLRFVSKLDSTVKTRRY